MLNLTEFQEYFKRHTKLLMAGVDDLFFFEVGKESIKIKSIDNQEYLLTEPLYVVAVRNLNRKECELAIGVKKPELDLESVARNSQTIVVKKGQYIKLKQEYQYQQSLKNREEKHNQLPQTRFKHWAKDIWKTKQKDIIVGLLLLIIGVLLGKAC